MTGSTSATARTRTPMPADIWVLVSAAFIVAIGYGIISPLLPQFAASFDMGITASSVVVSSFAVFRLIFAPSAGRLLDRLGERWVYVTGLIIVAASTFAVAMAQTYWQLLAFRGLGGLGSAMFSVSAMALIIRIAPPTARAKATGMYATAFLLGSIAGPVVGGLMAGWGMRIPFVIYAIALLLAALVVRIWLGVSGNDELPAEPAQDEGAHSRGDKDADTPEREERRTAVVGEPTGMTAELPVVADEQTPQSDSVPAGPARPRPAMRIREAWAHSAYRASLLGGFVNGWASMGIRMALYPLFAIQVLGVGSSESGLALTVFAAGTAAAVSVVGRCSDAHGRKPFALWGLVILGTSTILLGLWENLWAFLVLSAIAGMGAGFLNPAQQAAVADIVGNDRPGGRVISRFQMSVDTGAILGPILAAMMVDAVSYELAFAVSGALAFAAAFSWLRARETLTVEN